MDCPCNKDTCPRNKPPCNHCFCEQDDSVCCQCETATLTWPTVPPFRWEDNLPNWWEDNLPRRWGTNTITDRTHYWDPRSGPVVLS